MNIANIEAGLVSEARRRKVGLCSFSIDELVSRMFITIISEARFEYYSFDDLYDLARMAKQTNNKFAKDFLGYLKGMLITRYLSMKRRTSSTVTNSDIRLVSKYVSRRIAA